MYKKQQKTSKPTVEQKELILNKIISKKYNEFDNFLKGLDFKTFLFDITLQEYQQAAIKNALISLKLYTNNAEDLYFEYMQYKKENPALSIMQNQINRSSYSKDSVRKSYFNTLARGLGENNMELSQNDFSKGYIFNFSATFDDDIDLTTCAFNYNLERFNSDGYGKNISVLDSDSPKKIERIIESFILFTAIKLSKEKLFEEYDLLNKDKKEKLIYHNPLIIAVSDKVNTEDAGVKLYFKAILKILKEDLNIKNIVSNFVGKLKSTELYFGNSKLGKEFFKIMENINSEEVRKSVFYSNEISKVEACKIRGNDKELAFKSKNATKPFLLLNIGSIREWEKEYIAKLGVESGEDLSQSYFDSINDMLSPINIMMGSKVFNEGWDSNRVNIISFINIGSRNAKKYVLQTIGRGVRIEPFSNFIQRFDKKRN